MKLVSIILFLILPVLSRAQNQLQFTEVVSVDSVNQEELYQRARVWFYKSFKKSNEFIQMDDKDAGMIIGTQSFKYSKFPFGGAEGYINYMVSVSVKDGRYKVEMRDFIHSANPSNKYPASFGVIPADTPTRAIKSWGKGNTLRLWADMKEKSEDEAKAMMVGLKAAMMSVTKDDW